VTPDDHPRECRVQLPVAKLYQLRSSRRCHDISISDPARPSRGLHGSRAGLMAFVRLRLVGYRPDVPTPFEQKGGSRDLLLGESRHGREAVRWTSQPTIPSARCGQFNSRSHTGPVTSAPRGRRTWWRRFAHGAKRSPVCGDTRWSPDPNDVLQQSGIGSFRRVKRVGSRRRP